MSRKALEPVVMRLSQGSPSWAANLLAILLLALCQAAVNAQQTHERDHYAVASAAYREGNWRQASESLRQFIKLAGQDARAIDARFYLGEALVQTGQLAEARASYRAFLDQQPADQSSQRSSQDVATARFRVGETSFLLGDLKNAEAELQQFCTLHAANSLIEYALPYLAELALRRDEFEEALRIADRQLARGCSQPAKAQLTVARSYLAMKQPSAACEACREIQSDPHADFDTLAKSHLIMAHSYEQDANLQQAIRSYQRVAELRYPNATKSQVADRVDEYRAEALLRVAECQRREHQTKLARQALLAILTEFPGSEHSRRATAQLTELAKQNRSS